MARTLLYQWAKTNIVMLVNAGSLISTTAVTSVLGFAFWWVAARWFSPEAVGLGSATISAMGLLGTISTLGLGTLLIGELPRRPGEEGPLISASLIVAGGVGGCAGIVFALVAPFVATDFQVFRISGVDILLFAAGVSLTTIALVLDYALIGLLRGGLQLWRNTFFAVAKLAALFVVSLWLSQKVGLTIYTTWLVGNALSLALLTMFVVLKRGWSRRSYLPQWRLLRKLGSVALQHHIFNLLILSPTWILPVLVTILLSARVNAWFYVSFMYASFIFAVSNALTIVLYAMSSAHPAVLAHKARLTLGLGAVIVILANCVFQFATGRVLGVFGHIYAEQAAWSLHILALGTLPYLIRSHYVAICRVQGRILYALLPMAAGTLLELSAATLGARLGGLSGLSLGWVAALCAEAVFMSRTVFKAVWPIDVSTNIDQLQPRPLQYDYRQMVDTQAEEPGFDGRSDDKAIVDGGVK
jgi:O-antigen/teichoic acid export membrane protein